MATTTNYAWETPDDTDLVKDGAAAIRTLGSSIDTTTKALNPSTTLGDIEYRSSTANTNTRLGIGTTGQVLTVSGGVPSWATPAGGGGKVLQVVQSTFATETDNSTSTFVDTGLTVNITPSASTSKVLIMVAIPIKKSAGNANTGVNLRLFRGATQLIEGFQLNLTGTALQFNNQWATNYLDSPATTSATTYKVQFASSSNAAYARICESGSMATIIALEIGA